jgi:hypoxanthine phosphoribosyltransferase
MAQKPYDYTNRKGILPISWNHFHGICRALAAAVAGYRPEIILPIGRGGYYPGTLLAHMLQVEIYPVRLSRRIKDRVIHQHPRWLLEPPDLVNGRRVLVVDEICGQGETIQMVKSRVQGLGAAEIKSAVMYAHTWGVDVPDFIGLISDALILNPWDREIYRDGEFHLHPEYAAALARQNIAADPALFIKAVPVALAKG